MIRKVNGSLNPFTFPDFLWVRNVIPIIFLGLSGITKAGDHSDPVGARSAGLSHTSVMLTDGWSSFNNQAGLGYLNKKISAGMFYESKYSVKELSTKALYVSYPLRSGALAATFRNFGYSKYGETKVGLAYGMKLTKRFAIGVQANYLQNHFTPEYDKIQTIAAEIGLISEPVDNLFIGFHLFKPALNKSNTAMYEQIVRFGISYLYDDMVLVTGEIVPFGEYTDPGKLGVELILLKNLFIRCGISAKSNYSFGLGYSLKRIKADVSFTKHQILGFSPQISLGIEF